MRITAHRLMIWSPKRGSAPGRAAGRGGVIAVAAVLAAAISGCASGPRISDRNVRFLDYDQLRAALADSGKSVRLIDVRSPRAYQHGHLPGAVNVPLAELRGLSARLRAADMVVVYATAQNELSTAGAKKLIAAGYDNIYAFRGGIDTWRKRGGDIMTPSDSGTRMG